MMNVKLFLKNSMLWCAAYNCSNSNKNNPNKLFLILLKNGCTRKAWTATVNQKEGTHPKNVYLCSNHFEEACFDKSWALQAELFYTSRSQKRKLVSHKENMKE